MNPHPFCIFVFQSILNHTNLQGVDFHSSCWAVQAEIVSDLIRSLDCQTCLLGELFQVGQPRADAFSLEECILFQNHSALKWQLLLMMVFPIVVARYGMPAAQLPVSQLPSPLPEAVWCTTTEGIAPKALYLHSPYSLAASQVPALRLTHSQIEL